MQAPPRQGTPGTPGTPGTDVPSSTERDPTSRVMNSPGLSIPSPPMPRLRVTNTIPEDTEPEPVPPPVQAYGPVPPPPASSSPTREDRQVLASALFAFLASAIIARFGQLAAARAQPDDFTFGVAGIVDQENGNDESNESESTACGDIIDLTNENPSNEGTEGNLVLVEIPALVDQAATENVVKIPKQLCSHGPRSTMPWFRIWKKHVGGDHGERTSDLLYAQTLDENPYELEFLSVIFNLDLAYNVYHIIACAAQVSETTKDILTRVLDTLKTNTLPVPKKTSREPPQKLTQALGKLGLDLLASNNDVIELMEGGGRPFLLCLHSPSRDFKWGERKQPIIGHFVFAVVMPRFRFCFPCCVTEKTLCVYPVRDFERFMENVGTMYNPPRNGLKPKSVYAFAYKQQG